MWGTVWKREAEVNHQKINEDKRGKLANELIRSQKKMRKGKMWKLYPQRIVQKPEKKDIRGHKMGRKANQKMPKGKWES